MIVLTVYIIVTPSRICWYSVVRFGVIKLRMGKFSSVHITFG